MHFIEEGKPVAGVYDKLNLHTSKRMHFIEDSMF